MLPQLESQRTGSESGASAKSSSQSESGDDGTESVTSSARHENSKRLSDSSATSVDEWEVQTKESKEAPTKHTGPSVSKTMSEVIASGARKRRTVFEVAVGGFKVTGLSRPSGSTQGDDGRMPTLTGPGTCGFIFLIAMLVVGGCWTFVCAIGS